MEKEIKTFTDEGFIYNGKYATFEDPAITGRSAYEMSAHISGVSISYSLPGKQDRPIDERLLAEVEELGKEYREKYAARDFAAGEVYMGTPGSIVFCQFTWKDKGGEIRHGTMAYYPSYTQKVIVCEDPSMPHTKDSCFVYSEAAAAAGISLF